MEKLRKRSFLLTLILALVMCFACSTALAAEEEVGDLIYSPSAMLATDDGGMLIVDSDNHCIWKRDASGKTAIVAGVKGKAGTVDKWLPEGADEAVGGENALFDEIWGIAPYLNGYIITEYNPEKKHGVLRYYDPAKGVVTLKNPKDEIITFKKPTGVTKGPDGGIFVADTGAHCIYYISAPPRDGISGAGEVTLYAGKAGTKGCADGSKKSKARFRNPMGIYYTSGKLYVADTGNNRIVKITDSTKKAATIAGSTKGTEGDKIGKPTKECRLYAPENVYYKSSTVVIADTGNSCVKVLKDGKVTRKIKESSMIVGSTPMEPRGLLVIDKTLYVGDLFAKRLVKKTL